MRKIETAEEHEKRKQKRIRAISLFLLGIMILSSVGFAFMTFQQGSQGKAAGNAQLQSIDDRYILEFQGVQMALTSSKESVKNVSVDSLFSLSNFAGKPLYIDAGNNSLAIYELATTLGQYTEKVSQACLGNCTEDFPEKDCSTPLLVYRAADTNRVYQNDSCVFMEGDIRAVDAFIYSIFSNNIS